MQVMLLSESPGGGKPFRRSAPSRHASGAPPRRTAAFNGWEGPHPDGNVLSPIVWLANFLRERGLGLQAGQAVIAGSYAGVLELPLGQQLHIGFGALGTLPIRFFFSE
jgi:2-keto-4-pentenoate hydratase